MSKALTQLTAPGIQHGQTFSVMLCKHVLPPATIFRASYGQSRRPDASPPCKSSGCFHHWPRNHPVGVHHERCRSKSYKVGPCNSHLQHFTLSFNPPCQPLGPHSSHTKSFTPKGLLASIMAPRHDPLHVSSVHFSNSYHPTNCLQSISINR